MNVGEKIKELRKSKGLNQTEFGKLFDPKATGGMVGKWERNINAPTPVYKDQLLKMTNETYSEFFGSEYIGKKYGELTVIDDLGSSLKKGRYRKTFICECSCGNIKKLSGEHVIYGEINSCGHLKMESASKQIQSIMKRDLVEKGTNLNLINPKNKLKKNNTSGKTGVYFYKKTNKWVARITLKGEEKYLGAFDNKEDAIKARLKAEEEYFVPVLEKHKDVLDK